MSISNRHLIQKIKRVPMKWVLAPLLPTSKVESFAPGYSIVLGVPWLLRELLAVNLKFIERMNLEDLDRIYIMFDRVPQPGSSNFINEIKSGFSNLPLEFRFYPPLAGRIVQKINRSKFYASLNWVLGLVECKNKYAVLHDFDLYPLNPNLFSEIVNTMREKELKFSGAEHTYFDGLKDEDGIIGTWELGVDVEWLWNKNKPIKCFHDIASVNGRYVDLDAFSAIQSKTIERELSFKGENQRDLYIHVRNLCSMYLRFFNGQHTNVGWRFHFLWYLQSLVRGEEMLEEIVLLMKNASSSILNVHGQPVDFSDVHHTCANVLRDDLKPMDQFLYNQPRPVLDDYLGVTEEFLLKYGDSTG